MVAIAERALPARVQQRRVLQRQQDDGVVVEGFELSDPQAEVAALAARVRLLPERLQKRRRRSDLRREPFQVAVEDRQLRAEDQQAQVEGAREEAVDRPERRRERDRFAVERVIVDRQQAFGRGKEIQVLGVALQIEVRAARVVGRDRRKRKGIWRGGRGFGGLGRGHGFRGRGVGRARLRTGSASASAASAGSASADVVSDIAAPGVGRVGLLAERRLASTIPARLRRRRLFDRPRG